MNLIETIAAKKSSWTIGEVAKLFSCSTTKLYDLVGSGNIPHFRLGTMIRFDPEALAAWVQSTSFGGETSKGRRKR